MAGGVEHQPGGILALHRLVTEHERAARHDLLRAGYRLEDLGSPYLSWADLYALLLAHASPDSAVAYALHGDIARWTQDTHLLALIVDLLNGANWQRAGNKGPRPKPVTRPRDKALRRLSAKDLQADRLQSGVIGSAAPMGEIQAWLEAKNGR